MADYEFILPLSIKLKHKKTKDKRVSINLNQFRSMHHRTYTEAKKAYCEAMREQIEQFDFESGKLNIHYNYYAARDNTPDLDNFVGAAKKFMQDAMVKCGFIEDDNVNFITGNSDKYCGIDRVNPRIEMFITVI